MFIKGPQNFKSLHVMFKESDLIPSNKLTKDTNLQEIDVRLSEFASKMLIV